MTRLHHALRAAAGASAGGGGGWTPADITTALWLDAADDTTITLDGSNNVTLWSDKSGNGRDASPDSGSEPTRSGNAIEFTPSSGLYGAAWGQISSQMVAVVFRYRSGTEAYARVFTQTDGSDQDFEINGHYIPIVRDDNFGRFGSQCNGDRRSTYNLSADTDAIVISNHNGSSLTNYLDGSGSGEYIHTLDRSFDQYGIGDRPNGSNALDGLIYEVVVADDSLSDSDRERLEGYLAHKWGLEANLPSDHPYKNEAP